MLIYSSAAVTVNGKLLAEATTVEVEYVDSDEVLFALGAGTDKTVIVNPQARHMRISWDQAVPSQAPPSGLPGFIEGVTLLDNPFDYLSMYVDNEPATISVISLGRVDRIVGVNGLIQTPRMRFSVGQNSVLSLSWIGEQAAPETNALQLTQFA